MPETRLTLADQKGIILAALHEPKHPFRYVSTLAKLIGDDIKDHVKVKVVLRTLMLGTLYGPDQNLACDFLHWALDPSPRYRAYVIRRDENGHAIPASEAVNPR